ncbi:MAG: heavy metal-associated domain-containing protein [Elusimicrobiales bacterium]|nr:heavy metal-associated domain-containing protein [Elusimicrobiales bacterium]
MTTDMFETVFSVGGMSCCSCASRVRGILTGRSGVEGVDVNLGAGEVSVRRRPGGDPPEALAAAISAAGYCVSVTADGPAR